MYTPVGSCSTNLITLLGISGIPVIVIALVLIGGTVVALPITDLDRCPLAEVIVSDRVSDFSVSACEVIYAAAHLDKYTGWLSQPQAGERIEYIEPKLIADFTGFIAPESPWDQARNVFLFEFAFWNPANPDAVYFRDGDAILVPAGGAPVFGPPPPGALEPNVANIQLVIVDVSKLADGDLESQLTAAASFLPSSEGELHGGPFGDHNRLGHSQEDYDGDLLNGEVQNPAIVDIIDTTLYIECLVARMTGVAPRFTADDFFRAPSPSLLGAG